jgi:hypothetical protein
MLAVALLATSDLAKRCSTGCLSRCHIALAPLFTSANIAGSGRLERCTQRINRQFVGYRHVACSPWSPRSEHRCEGANCTCRRQGSRSRANHCRVTRERDYELEQHRKRTRCARCSDPGRSRSLACDAGRPASEAAWGLGPRSALLPRAGLSRNLSAHFLPVSVDGQFCPLLGQPKPEEPISLRLGKEGELSATLRLDA